MSWARVDDQYPDHPKITEVGPLGMALHMAAICYCARYLTDGFVPTRMIDRLISLEGINVVSNGISNAVTNKEVTEQLVKVGLFEVVEGGYYVHDYLEYNPPAEQVKRERAENAERQKKWRVNHRDGNGKFTSNTVSNALYNTAPTPTPIKEDIYNSQLSDEFTRITGILPHNLEDWTKADQELTKAGITVDEIPIVLQVMQSKEYQYSGLPSIVKTARWVHAERQAGRPVMQPKSGNGSKPGRKVKTYTNALTGETYQEEIP